MPAFFQATAVGEWVEVKELLDLSGINDDIVALGTVNVPITEVHTSMLTGQGSFSDQGSISVLSMIMDFYTTGDGAFTGIWASNMSGDFTGLA